MSKVDFKDIEIFSGKSLDDLFKELYTSTKERNKDLKSAITSTVARIKNNTSDPESVLMPLSLMAQAAIKNDENLIKLASIVQKFHSKTESKEDSVKLTWSLPEDEMEKIYQLVPTKQDVSSPIKLIDTKEEQNVSSSGSSRD
jgi:hypothetical protein